MKKISTNHDDCSFENKHKFEELLNKVKALGGSIIKNGKQTCIMAMMVGCVLFSVSNIYKAGTDVFEFAITYSLNDQVNEFVISYNDNTIKNFTDGVVVAKVASSFEKKYHFQNNYLYDNQGNYISLDDSDKPVCLLHCKIDSQTLNNMQLPFSRVKILTLNECSIDNECIESFPRSLEELSLDRCTYITNLDLLPWICPNITKLSLNAIPNLSDLSFIYRLPNLKELYISDSAYITEELLSYLEANNITTNLTEKDVSNSKRIDEIISSIITPTMSDREKIQAICLYVLDNVDYDATKVIVSNLNPLNCVLEDGKGVCASYTYLTNVLLGKANISSFKVGNGGHSWNLVDLDDKYYYIDTTNMDEGYLYNLLLRALNITKFYMIDPSNTLTTPMSSPLENKTIIPLSLIEDIQKGTSEKDIFERYGGQAGNFGVILASMLSVIVTYLGFSYTLKIIQEAPSLYSNIKKDYNDLVEEFNNPKMK